MLRIMMAVILVFSLQITVACTSDKPSADAQEAITTDDEKRMPRRKIERLDSKTFIELSIDLMREETKWRGEWANYMQDKRKQYYESFGLTEKQFSEFAERNSTDLQRFLRENPRYSQEYAEAMYPHDGP